jgi:hypothetical protein
MADLKLIEVNSVQGKYYDFVNQYEPDTNNVISQKIKLRLNTSKGEWQEDTDFGINTTLVVQNSDNPDIVGQIIADEVLKVPNVISVDISADSIDDSTRQYSLGISAKTSTSLISVRI